MGVMLPKPVTSKVYERECNPAFRSGSACVNGYRESMEDAHIMYLADKWGFFGIFDGHVNEQCSKYLEEQWRAELKKPDVFPMSDEKLKEIALDMDKRFLQAQNEGGSTGTFFFATVSEDAKTVHLQVGNVGDSRVLVCHKGQCVPMTVDHKPALEAERVRIESCGGRVENGRVDGSLAVSRAFGDRDYKQGSGSALNQKVTALADVTHIELDRETEYALLACDGVFEGDFSNDQVIEFVSAKLKAGAQDLARLAGEVCEEAILRGSKDNISCVIVMFKQNKEPETTPRFEFVPGPFNAPESVNFRKAYQAMAQMANLSVGEALEIRYNNILKLSAEENDENLDEEEAHFFKDGPPRSLTGPRRSAWFQDRFAELETDRDASSRAGVSHDVYQRAQTLQQQIGIPLPMLLELMQDMNAQGGGRGR